MQRPIQSRTRSQDHVPSRADRWHDIAVLATATIIVLSISLALIHLVRAPLPLLARGFVPIVIFPAAMLVGFRIYRRVLFPRLRVPMPDQALLSCVTIGGSVLVGLLAPPFLGFPVGFSFGFSIMALIGIMFIFTALAVRRGSSRHCAFCGHEFAPTEISPARCLECGRSTILKPLEGRPSPSRGVLWAGIVLTLVGLSSYLVVIPGIGSAMAGATPTWFLLMHARHGTTQNETHTLWNELGTRTLTAEQREDLVRRLLDRRRREGRLGFSSAPWLDAQVTLLPPDSPLLERAWAETIEPRLELPARAAAGQEIPWRLAGTYRLGPVGTTWGHVRVVSIELDGVPIDGAPSPDDDWLFGLYLGSPGDQPRTRPPSGTIPPQPPGTYRVTARIVHAITLSGTMPPSGTAPPPPLSDVAAAPPPPPPPVLWWRESVVEREIRVEPREDR
ncbi:MAG: hypothetical protein KF817_07635 [Phycisphaeraceae bacterium]|nr:hypothetical protein [Phycisphaeraceae bacterium]